MLLAELEIFHSRPVAPTRRLALGRRWLPCGPDLRGPGAGGVLLGAICARFGPELPDELMGDVFTLADELEQGRRIPQPRLRHRLQSDRVGLTRSVQRLHRRGGRVVSRLDGSRARPGQLVLGAVYAAGSLPSADRAEAMEAVRRGLAWGAARDLDPVDGGSAGPVRADQSFVDHLWRRSGGAGDADRSASPTGVGGDLDPVAWALGVLGFDGDDRLPDRAAVQRGFRDALREAHPDHGGAGTGAAARIADLSEARRILLAS